MHYVFKYFNVKYCICQTHHIYAWHISKMSRIVRKIAIKDFVEMKHPNEE